MIVGRLIPAGTGLAYHETRKRAAAAANAPAAEGPSEAMLAAEAMFTQDEAQVVEVTETDVTGEAAAE